MRRKSVPGATPARTNRRSKGLIALWVGGVCFLAGSLAVGITGLSTATPGPSTVFANQGSAGSAPWPVSASGSVGVNNFPSTQNVSGSVGVNNLPSTQNVSGSVGVNNFPSTQNVSGSVGVNNFPSTQNVSGSVNSSDTTTEIANSGGVFGGVNIPPSTFVTVLPPTDVSSYREVTLYINNVNGPTECSVLYDTNENVGYTFDFFTLSISTSPEYTKTYDLAPPKLEVACFNSGTTADTISFTLTGRAN